MAEIGADIQKAADLLRAGELVAIPTETVYGLAANALSEAAVVKIFEAKNRPAFDPLIVHVKAVSEFFAYAEDIPEAALKLAQNICPGPVTFIFRKKSNIPDLVTSGHATVGLRVPNHPLTLKLLKELDFPLAAPSANPFGYTSPTTAQHVQAQLGDKLPYILDGGPCAIGLESTIIDFSGSDTKILRLGGLSVELLEDQLGQKLKIQTSSSNPKAPGMLSSHYNPGVKISVGERRSWEDVRFRTSEPQNFRSSDLQRYDSHRIGVLAFTDYVAGVPKENQRILSPSGDLAEAARNFFTMLREFNNLPVDVVLAEWLPDEGLGRAINDRLKRAAAV
jgi:L-threonylcarbamoyladenylate synthase